MPLAYCLSQRFIKAKHLRAKACFGPKLLNLREFRRPPERKPCMSDVSAEEWCLVAPYLVLLGEGAGPRRYPVRELLNDLRAVLRMVGQREA